METLIHYGLHLGLPFAVALLFYRSRWKEVSLILLATMLVDLDHLLATPIFDPNRCSIGFHLLHSYYAIGIYFLMLFFKPLRIIAIGLLLHMVTDWLDCFMH